MSSLLLESLKLFKSPDEKNSVHGLVKQAQEDQVSGCTAFWGPLLVGMIFAALALGIIGTFFEELEMWIKILIPSGVAFFCMFVGYLYYCVCAHYNKRNEIMRHAHGNFKRITTIIKHRATEFNQLDLDQRMTILAAALEPMKELLIADKAWDRRGKYAIANFI